MQQERILFENRPTSRRIVLVLASAVALWHLAQLRLHDFPGLLLMAVATAALDLGFLRGSRPSSPTPGGVVVLAALFRWGHLHAVSVRLLELALVVPILHSWRQYLSARVLLIELPVVIMVGVGARVFPTEPAIWRLAEAVTVTGTYGFLAGLLFVLSEGRSAWVLYPPAFSADLFEALRQRLPAYSGFAMLGWLLAELWGFLPYSSSLLATLFVTTFAGYYLRRANLALEADHRSLLLLMDMVEAKDPHTAGHARRVAAYATAVLVAIRRFPAWNLERLFKAALLHDIGKLIVPEYIVTKPGRLTSEEYALVKEHPEAGVQLTSRILSDTAVLAAIRHHHERYDGTGYPGRLAGTSIPLWARLIAIADAFDAMTSDRPYRRALSVDQALAELQRYAGSQFDPGLVPQVLPALRAAHARLDQLPEAGRRAQAAPASAGTVNLGRSRILKSFSALGTVYWDDAAGLQRVAGPPLESEMETALWELARRTANLVAQEGLQSVLVSESGRVYDVRLLPTGLSRRVIHVSELTPVLQLESSRDQAVLEVYRNVFSTITKGELALVDETELQHLAFGRELARVRLQRLWDVGQAREAIAAAARQLALPEQAMWRLTLAASEACTNAITHAGGGEFLLLDNGLGMAAVIRDRGPGIDLSRLLDAVLSSQSTLPDSLGDGFEIMLLFAEKVHLHTNHQGTTVVLWADAGQTSHAAWQAAESEAAAAGEQL